MPTAVTRSAWADESFAERDHSGFYLIAAAAIEPQAEEPGRDAMRRLLGRRRTDKLHFFEMDFKQRQLAAEAVAQIDGVHLVAVGSPVPPRRQERARTKCLAALVPELHGFGIQRLVLESRGPALDARDATAIARIRGQQLPRGARFRAEHQRGGDEELLWLADVVAGCCRAHHLGVPDHRDALGEKVLDFEVPTDC